MAVEYKKDIEEKNALDAITYASARLSKAEEILINTKACKDTDKLEEYINFLKGFIISR